MYSIALNLLITIAQVVGGILSGSLALISDALHNFSDFEAVSLINEIAASDSFSVFRGSVRRYPVRDFAKRLMKSGR